jgi:hypothetical protein
VNWAATAAPATDGLWFGVDGEGGTSADYRSYVGNPAGLQTQWNPPTNGMASADSAGGIYPTLFPTARFETLGAPGKNWVAVELTQTNNVLTWKLDDTIIARRTNTSAFTSGNIMLGYMDPFASIASPAADAFVLFDNVRVENLGATPFTTNFQLTSAGVMSNGWVQLLLYGGSSGQSCTIEASTNLINWLPLATFLGTNGPQPFIDTNAVNFPKRFYRATHD